MDKSFSLEDKLEVAKLLGREPRGLEAVQVRDQTGNPSVIRVASLVEGKPFPTLFWLVNKEINYKIDVLEANGAIALLQEQVDASQALQASLCADHKSYIGIRKQYMTEGIKTKLIKQGYYDDLMQRGVGGIANFGRIRCLHTFYAFHLVKKNTVGFMIDQILL